MSWVIMCLLCETCLRIRGGLLLPNLWCPKHENELPSSGAARTNRGLFSPRRPREDQFSQFSHFCRHVMKMLVGMLMTVVGDDGDLEWFSISDWQMKGSDTELTADRHMQSHANAGTWEGTKSYKFHQIPISERIDWWIYTFRVAVDLSTGWYMNGHDMVDFSFTIPSLILKLWWHKYA